MRAIYRPGQRVVHVGAANEIYQPQPVAAAASWWLSGGIAAANCIAAYTPKGAASYAASKDNNAAPGNGLPDGTYDATDGAAFPTWDAATGWTFDSGSSQYLQTGIDPGNAWSVFIQFTGVSGVNGTLIGERSAAFATDGLMVQPNAGGASVLYQYGARITVAPQLLAGNLGIVNTVAYRNGVADGGAGMTGVDTANRALFIGAINQGAPANYLSGKIVALAIYNTAITGAQITALTTAMAAL